MQVTTKPSPPYQVTLESVPGVTSSAKRFGLYRAGSRAELIAGKQSQESAKTADSPKGKAKHSRGREWGPAIPHDHLVTTARGSLWHSKHSDDPHPTTRASHQRKGEDRPVRSSMGNLRYELRACRNRGSASSQKLRLRRSQDQFASSPISPTQFYPMNLFNSLQYSQYHHGSGFGKTSLPGSAF